MSQENKVTSALPPALRQQLASGTSLSTPVSGMRTFKGMLSSFWTSEQWKEAWGYSLLVAAFTYAISQSGIWVAESAGSFLHAYSTYHNPENLDPAGQFSDSAKLLCGAVALKIGLIATRHFFSQTLHRKWRGFLTGKFNEAILNDRHTLLHLQSNRGAEESCSPSLQAMPDNIDQRWQESIRSMTGGGIGLAMGIFGVVTSSVLVMMKLAEISQPIQGLDFLGNYGSLAITFGASALYVPVLTYGFYKIGRVLEKLDVAMQKAEGTFRAELTTLLRRAAQISASAGESVQKKINKHLYGTVDKTWHKQNGVNAVFMGTNNFYNEFSSRIFSYMVAAPAYMQKSISLKDYATSAELVGEFIRDCSWLINVMPAIASLRANSNRIIEVAEAVEKVQDARAFYKQSGISEFEYSVSLPDTGLTVKDLALMHEGMMRKPL
ncbi:MAG: hypothetical protein LRZ85_00790 [Alphaproteobacteria bacterium]|nr:hypothetical protein [Alphaproteobacteria bacterium]